MKLSNKKYDAVFILGGSLIKDNGVWRTCRFDEGDNFGVLGDVARVAAGNILFKKEITDRIIALGGKGQYKDNADFPTITSVIKKELVQLGVPPNQIEENLSDGTYGQLKTILEIANQRNWIKVAIISNEYHLPRISAMIKYAPNIGDLNNLADLISAEKILIDNDRTKWQKEIKEIYESAGMQRRIAIEQKGIQDIKTGKYKFRNSWLQK